MNRGTKFGPIKPPPRGVAFEALGDDAYADEQRLWEADIAERISGLLVANDLADLLPPLRIDEGHSPQNIAEEQWRRVALSLAFKLALQQKDPRFALADFDSRPTRRLGDEQDFRDSLMDQLIWGKDQTLETRAMSDVQASQKVRAALLSMTTTAQEKSRVPSSGSIRSQYSRRINAAKRAGRNPFARGVPWRIRYFLELQHTLAMIDNVASIVPYREAVVQSC